jgi:hypothetical protein
MVVIFPYYRLSSAHNFTSEKLYALHHAEVLSRFDESMVKDKGREWWISKTWLKGETDYRCASNAITNMFIIRLEAQETQDALPWL